MVDNTGIRLREVDLKKLLGKILKFKKLLAINISVAFVLSSFIILCVPRYYVCDVKLAPETSTPSTGGLGALAASFGINMSNMVNQDAIVPDLYPDLVESVDFQTSMFNVKITNQDSKINTSYYEYLHNHQKHSWWEKIFIFLKNMVHDKTDGNARTVDPFKLTKEQGDIVKIVNEKITCKVDKKTSVITISVKDQDPLVCATIADTARVRLQQFIIKYRTNKARIDLDYTKKLHVEAKKQYDRARRAYAAYSDANQGLVLESYKSRLEDLENEMQLMYNNYQQVSMQLQLARAKLQERTPAFTTLQSASVPLKPAGPKRMIFVMFWMFAAFAGTVLYVARKDA